jgi:hypothetical protein
MIGGQRLQTTTAQLLQPAGDYRVDRIGAPERMVAGHADDFPVWAGRRHPKRVALSLHDEHGHAHRLELEKAALGRVIGSAGRVQRESQTEHGHRASLSGGPACHPGARGSAADHQRKVLKPDFMQLPDHRQPRSVELTSGWLAAPPRYSIGLFDQRDAEANRERRLRRLLKVGRLDTSAGPVPQHQRGDRALKEVRTDPCRPMGRVQLENGPRVPVAGGRTEWRPGTLRAALARQPECLSPGTGN